MGNDKGTSMSQREEGGTVLDEEYVGAFQVFIERHHGEALEAILHADDEALHYPLIVEYADFLDASPALANLLYFLPCKLLPLFDAAVREAQVAVYEANIQRGSMTIKENVHVRLNVHGSALECPETHPNIGRIRVEDVGRLLTLKGTVIRSGGVKILEGEREFECTKCKNRIKVEPELDLGNIIQLPLLCPSEKPKPCTGTKFRRIEESTAVCHDYQEIKIQESMQTLGVGSVPRSIVVVLEDDLVDTTNPGDEVMVTGLLYSKWRSPVQDVRCDLELMFQANYIKKANEMKTCVEVSDHMVEQFEEFWRCFSDNPFKGRNAILQNICPQVYGLFTVKLAVALTLIGGVQHVDASGTRVRGESHLLLVGDPGTGKSQFLKYAAKLSHRSVMTTGLGSTSAGLTVTAVRDTGEWMLEAGALVLADGGLCCIDEFDSIREPDRATIHEAMEQQTLSVAKAGLVTTLNTRTTVFGVTNPKGHYDPSQPLTVNTTLSGPLLSRFDIVLVLLDTKNPEWDKIVSSHILSEHTKPKKPNNNNGVTGIWTMAMLQSYIRYVRREFKPVLTTEAENVISSYYQLQRRSAPLNAARTTIRMLESLIRLAQGDDPWIAHARLMFRRDVTQADAIAAVVCVESSMTTSAILDGMGNALHSSFAINPDEEYAKQEQAIMSKLNLLTSTSSHLPPNDFLDRIRASEIQDREGGQSTAHQSEDEADEHPGEDMERSTDSRLRPSTGGPTPSALVLSRLRNRPPSENASGSQAKRLKATKAAPETRRGDSLNGGLEILSVIGKMWNPLGSDNGANQPTALPYGGMDEDYRTATGSRANAAKHRNQNCSTKVDERGSILAPTQTEEGLLLGNQCRAEDFWTSLSSPPTSRPPLEGLCNFTRRNKVNASST